MRWQIHQKGKLQLLTESEVMRRLANGKLTGLELARRGGEGDWHPLHATPLFQAVPHTGSAGEAARERARRGLMFHFATFACVMAVLTVTSGQIPWWGLFWLLGVAGHASRTLSALKRSRQADDAPNAVTEASSDVAPAHAAGPPQSETTAAIDDLVATGWDGDADALREVALELAERRDTLTRTVQPEATAALLKEREAADITSQSTQDAATYEALTSQVSAIDSHLAFLQDAERLLTRTVARERALLHQVRALSLGALQTTDDEVNPIGDQITQLRRELQADAEVTNTLARARLSAQHQKA